MGRHADFAPRRGHKGTRVVVDESLTAQITQEGSDRRKLARGGRARLTSLVENSDEPPDGIPIERTWPQLARLYRGAGGRVGEKLRQIALVGTHGVRGHVAIEPQKLQKCFQVRGHRSGTA